jgi:hypothetical protein
MNLRLMAVWFVIVAGLQLTFVPTYGLQGAAWGLLLGRALGLVALAGAVLASSIHKGGE